MNHRTKKKCDREVGLHVTARRLFDYGESRLSMGANSILSMHLLVQAVVSEVTEQVANVFLGQKLNKTHNII